MTEAANALDDAPQTFLHTSFKALLLRLQQMVHLGKRRMITGVPKSVQRVVQVFVDALVCQGT